jgi:YggT family protein
LIIPYLSRQIFSREGAKTQRGCAAPQAPIQNLIAWPGISLRLRRSGSLFAPSRLGVNKPFSFCHCTCPPRRASAITAGNGSRKDNTLLTLTLFQIVGYLISVIVMLVIVQFVMSLLISFNVVNMQNPFVESVWRAINALLDPILKPIRKIMPDTGAIDFSPMVLIILLQIVRIVLGNLAYTAV